MSWSPGQGAGASILPMFLNPKIGEEWFRRWATEMNVTIVTDARQGAEWVALGRFPIGMFGLNTQAEALKEQGYSKEKAAAISNEASHGPAARSKMAKKAARSKDKGTSRKKR